MVQVLERSEHFGTVAKLIHLGQGPIPKNEKKSKNVEHEDDPDDDEKPAANAPIPPPLPYDQPALLTDYKTNPIHTRRTDLNSLYPNVDRFLEDPKTSQDNPTLNLNQGGVMSQHTQNEYTLKYLSDKKPKN